MPRLRKDLWQCSYVCVYVYNIVTRRQEHSFLFNLQVLVKFYCKGMHTSREIEFSDT